MLGEVTTFHIMPKSAAKHFTNTHACAFNIIVSFSCYTHFVKRLCHRKFHQYKNTIPIIVFVYLKLDNKCFQSLLYSVLTEENRKFPHQKKVLASNWIPLQPSFYISITYKKYQFHYGWHYNSSKICKLHQR